MRSHNMWSARMGRTGSERQHMCWRTQMRRVLANGFWQSTSGDMRPQRLVFLECGQRGEWPSCRSSSSFPARARCGDAAMGLP